MDRNKYWKWYDRLIRAAKSRPVPFGCVEKHHIVPRSLGGSNGKANIAVLTAREHYVAHLLLARMHHGDARRKMLRALVRFAVKAGREFEIARKIIAREYTGEGNPSYGKRWSHHPDTNEIFYGRLLPSGNVPGLPFQRGGHTGTVWVNNGFEETLVQGNSIDDGWIVGRLNKPSRTQVKAAAGVRHTPDRDALHSAKMRGRVRVFDPGSGAVKKVAKAEVPGYLERGWDLRSVPVKNSKQALVDGVYYSTLAEAAKAAGVSAMTVSYRIKSPLDRWLGWQDATCTARSVKENGVTGH